jgi:Caspase domain
MRFNRNHLIIICCSFAAAACSPKTGPTGVSVESGSGGVVLRPTNTTPKAPMRLEWVSPLFVPGEVISVYKKLNLEVKAFTTANLKDGDFKVFVDEKPLAARSGEAPLEVANKQEYIFRKTIEFNDAEEQQHAIRVEVNNGGQAERSRTMLVRTTLKPPKINVTWIKPDVTELGNKIYLHTEPYLDLVATIETGGSVLELSQLRVRYNGNIIEPTKPLADLKLSSGAKYSFKYRLAMLNVAEEQTLSLIVENVESDVLRLKYSANKKPNLYILSIGTQTNLQYTVQDAVDFAGVFQNQTTGNALYNAVYVDQLLKAEAGTQGIRRAVNRLKTKMQTNDISPSDLVVLFLSTHGFLLENEFRLQGDDYNSAEEYATSVSFNEDILKILNGMPCKKLIFIDACHSGGAFDPAASGGRATASEVERALEKYNQYRSGLAILTSSSGDEISYEDRLWSNGAFTEAILRGLRDGKADTAVTGNKNGIVTVNELFAFLKNEVPTMVTTVKKKKQTPKLYDPDKIGDIPIYVVKK